MNKSELKAIFINAKATDAKYIGVSIQTEGSSQPEIIINPNPNFDAKFDYYMEAYDDDLILIAAKGKKDIRITAAGQGNRFEDIECQLLGELGKGWKELIAGAIDNAYEKMIATTPPTTEEEQTHCEMIKEAVKGMLINESRTAAEAEFIKTHIVDYEKIFDVCMNGDDLEFKKGLVRLQKMQNEYVMQRERGEMFYISRGGASYNGSEQHADRPAVVVSNNKNNENSNVVEVVYMTTQPKTDLPTHVTIRSTGRISTVLCEQVYSVSTERIGTYIGEATDKEMENIDIALMISLQLDNGIKTAKEYYKTIKEQQEEIDSLKREIETMQQEHEEAIAEIEQDAAVYVEENKKIANMTSSEDTIRLQTERDTYKTMYEQLLNRLVNGGAA